MKTAQSFIAGHWYQPEAPLLRQVINPASEELIGQLEMIDAAGLDAALAAAAAGFDFWKRTSAYDRASIMYKAVEIILSRRAAMDQASDMGPLANARRVHAMEELVADCKASGARLECGGIRMPGKGFFFQPTVFADVPESARIMSEEPFGPLAPIASFDDVASVTALVNQLPYGLAAYVMTRSLARAAAMSETLESGMVGINHFSVSTPASPFGGVKESGYGSEGGIEGLDAYLVVKTITQRISGSDLEPT